VEWATENRQEGLLGQVVGFVGRATQEPQIAPEVGLVGAHQPFQGRTVVGAGVVVRGRGSGERHWRLESPVAAFGCRNLEGTRRVFETRKRMPVDEVD
jgi:hypothetical protein